MNGVKFKAIKNEECIEGKMFYEKNEFIFNSNSGTGEFSLMIGNGYNELSVARFNYRIYSFGGTNVREMWIKKSLKFPNSEKGELYIQGDEINICDYDGEWYVRDWNTYYDEKDNIVCIGDCNTQSKDSAIEFCKGVIAVLREHDLKAIWIKNINFKE